MKQPFDKKTRKKITIIILGSIFAAHIFAYFYSDKNIVTFLKGFKHSFCCIKHFYFTQSYYGKIESIDPSGAMLGIEFENIDTTYLLYPYIEDGEEKVKLLNFIEEGMWLRKYANDSNLNFIDKHKDTLRFVYNLSPSKGAGPLLIYETKLENMERIPYNK